MSKEENKKQEFDWYVNRVKHLEESERLIMLDRDRLHQENKSLKHKIGGYKTANENYRKQVSELKERVKHYKALGIEGDELYEKKIADFDQQKKELEKAREVECQSERENELESKLSEKQNIIETLQDSVQKERVRVSELESEVGKQKEVITKLENTISELRKPWWKKLF